GRAYSIIALFSHDWNFQSRLLNCGPHFVWVNRIRTHAEKLNRSFLLQARGRAQHWAQMARDFAVAAARQERNGRFCRVQAMRFEDRFAVARHLDSFQQWMADELNF